MGISVFSVDSGSGTLSLVQTVASENPSFLALDPSQQRLYVVNEIDDFEGEVNGSIEAFVIDSVTGELTLINRENSGGVGPAYLTVDPTESAVIDAHYAGGNYTILPIRDDGGVAPVSDSVQNKSAGPNKERQESPHHYSFTFDSAGRCAVAADLCLDKLQVFSLDSSASILVLLGEAPRSPGAGPRHVAFLPDGGSLYVVSELDATITAFSYDAVAGNIGRVMQTISTVPDDFVGTKSTGEIAFHPYGRFLYGSNRGQPDAKSPEADSIVAYTVAQSTGELSLTAYATESIDYPRHFALDPTGSRLYACNQQTDTIAIFSIDQATGELSTTGQLTETPTLSELYSKAPSRPSRCRARSRGAVENQVPVCVLPESAGSQRGATRIEQYARAEARCWDSA